MSSPVGGAGSSGAAQRGAAELDLYDKDDLQVGKNVVLRDGYMDPADAEAAWRAFCGAAGLDVRKDKIKFAISCAAGTSAETDFTERYVDSQNEKSSVIRLIDILSTDITLSRRANKLRVFCRSLPGFALLTRAVIDANPWLARERAHEYEMDIRVAGVCFDYADALLREDIQLTPTELGIIKSSLTKKAGQGRSMAYVAEGQGVPGSAPRERGTFENVVPDAGRLSGRSAGGSGPFGR